MCVGVWVWVCIYVYIYIYVLYWQGMLEPLEVSIFCTIMELSDFVDSAPEALGAHKFFIFRGVQLHSSFTLHCTL